jgi:hypothetical protein
MSTSNVVHAVSPGISNSMHEFPPHSGAAKADSVMHLADPVNVHRLQWMSALPSPSSKSHNRACAPAIKNKSSNMVYSTT